MERLRARCVVHPDHVTDDVSSLRRVLLAALPLACGFLRLLNWCPVASAPSTIRCQSER